MSTRPDEDLLNDILRAAERIERRLRGTTREQFMDDDVLQEAVMLQIAVIGEAARNLSLEFRNAYPQIPWQDIGNMRNRLVHAYHLVSLAIVWDTATADIPDVVGRLSRSGRPPTDPEA